MKRTVSCSLPQFGSAAEGTGVTTYLGNGKVSNGAFSGVCSALTPGKSPRKGVVSDPFDLGVTVKRMQRRALLATTYSVGVFEITNDLI